MKKSVKTTVIAIASVLFLCVPLFVCLPPVQRFVCVKILSRHFDDVRIAEVDIGFSGLQAKDICVRHHDLTVKCAHLDVKWNLKDGFLQRIFIVENAALDGLMLSAENEPKDILYFEKKKANASGLAIGDIIGKVVEQLKLYTLPHKSPIAIGNLSVNGSFDAYEKVLGEFSLNVANFARSKATSIDFALDTDFEQQFVKRFRVAGHLAVNRDATGVIDSAVLNSLVCSKIGTAKHAKTFLFDVTYDKSAPGSLLHATFSNEQTLEKVFDALFSFDESVKNIGFQTNIQVNNLAGFGANFGQFSCHAFSTGEYDMTSSNGLIKSNLEATIPREFLGQVFPELKSDLQLKVVSSIGILGEFIELQSINGELCDVNGEQVNCSMELVDKRRLSWVNGGNPLRDLNGLVLNLNVDGVDTSILGAARNGWRLSSMASGKCIVTIKNNQLSILSGPDKFCLTPFKITYNGVKVLDEFECFLEPKITVGDALKCDVCLACMDDSGTSVLQGDLGFAADKKSRSCSGCLVCSLTNLLAQPIFTNEMQLTSGFATCSFDFAQEGNICAGDAELKLKTISHRGSKSPLSGNLDVNFANATSDENKLKFTVEGRLHDTMDSDISISGVVSDMQMPDNGTRIDIKSSVICLSDITTVCKLFAINLSDGSGPQEDFLLQKFSPASDTFTWDEFSFDTLLQIDALYLDDDIKLCSNLSCDLQVEPKSVNLSKLVCYILDAPLVASGSVAFISDDYADMYKANLHFSLSDLSASKFMLLLNRHPKTLTGTFRAKGSFSSSQPFLGDLLSHAQGKVDIMGSDGSISPMASFGNEQKGFVGLAGVAGGLVNSDIVNELMQILENIPYDSMSASIIRHDNSDIILDSFFITGSNIRVVANGALTARRGFSPKDYALCLEMQINTRNNATKIFDGLGWSSDAFDFYGYKVGPRFSIRGTPRNPDLTEVKRLLISTSAKLLSEWDSQESAAPGIDPKILLKMFQK
ncbi:MAG: AsmA-like C-terminal region-containing protein [Puniceicoccales bacterium]|nr:AsmA-like C-terminal region-containing protein [Puniceicoccales bacterium]